jgi:hypothetical protein
MEIGVLVEGEGLLEIETIRLSKGVPAERLIAAVAAKGGFPAGEAVLFVEDEDEPLDFAAVVIDEHMGERIHHVHRARHVEVTVFYQGREKNKSFRPSARVQRVLDWAVGRDGFNIDPAIAPEMELALHGQTVALPKSAHIGRFVHHPHHSVAFDLIRGVVPNGGDPDPR